LHYETAMNNKAENNKNDNRENIMDIGEGERLAEHRARALNVVEDKIIKLRVHQTEN